MFREKSNEGIRISEFSLVFQISFGLRNFIRNIIFLDKKILVIKIPEIDLINNNLVRKFS